MTVEILQPHAVTSNDNDVAGLLAREANHRIANSLQLLSAALRLETLDAATAEVPSLQAAMLRVDAIAVLHRLLCDKIDTELEADRYLAALVTTVCSALGIPRAKIAFEAERIRLPPDVLSSLGMLVHELVCNAFKHGSCGVIAVTLLTADDDIDLCVRSRGAIRGRVSGSGSGSGIVAALVRRLGATFSMRQHDGGASATVYIPILDRAPLMQ